MSRQSDNEKVWGLLILAAIAILVIVAIFKILFWISIVAMIIGLIWVIISLIDDWGNLNLEDMWIPLLLLFGGIVLCYISYQIGYGFEQSPGGKQLIDLANTILGVEKTRTELPQQVAQQTINSVVNATSG